MRTVCVWTKKGGVGKTTIAVNLAAGIADAGKRTVLVDLDPAGGATEYLPEPQTLLFRPPPLADVLDGRADLADAAVPFEAVPRLAVVRADPALAGRERDLRDPHRLRAALAPLARRFDVVILDTPPAWSFLSLNALTAARYLLAPTEAKPLSLASLVDVVRTVEDVSGNLNPSLRLAGVIPSRVQRTRLATESLEDLRRHFPGRVLPAVRESARVAESAGYHLPVSRYAPESIGAEDLARLTRAVLRILDA